MSILAHFEQFSGKTFADAKALYLRDFRGKDIGRVKAALDSTAPYIDHLRLITVDNEALDMLGAADPRLAQVVEMRYFGGLSESEIAEALDVTERTVRRDWSKARLFLREALK